MRHLLSIVLLGLALTGRADTSRLITRLEAGTPQTVVAYGTSLTAAGAWVSQLEQTLAARYPGKAKVVNSGGSGQWSQWGVKHLDERVLAHRPNAVFLEFSINDSVARFGCSVALARRNLETMIDRILAGHPNCEIFLMTMTPGNRYPEGHRSHRKDLPAYYAMVRTVARKRHLTLIDHAPRWLTLQETDPERFQRYVPDTIHPTAEGNAAVVTPAIIEALGSANDT